MTCSRERKDTSATRADLSVTQKSVVSSPSFVVMCSASHSLVAFTISDDPGAAVALAIFPSANDYGTICNGAGKLIARAHQCHVSWWRMYLAKWRVYIFEIAANRSFGWIGFVRSWKSLPCFLAESKSALVA